MGRKALLAIILAMLAAASTLGLVAPAQGLNAQAGDSTDAAAQRQAEHARVMDFWTPERVAQAVPRDFLLDNGRLRPAAKKPGGGTASGSTSVLGASWNDGGAVANTTGKVLFALGGSYYVCSASVVNDNSTAGRSIILTAGHCVYDAQTRKWATNWMFIPNYDANPVRLDTRGSFCSSTVYGCWVADALVASKSFTTAGGFNTQATLHDYAFAVVSTGGLTTAASNQLDTTVGTQNVNFATGSVGSTAWLFGYPAGSPYTGKDLVYSANSLGLDPLNSNRTYRVSSSMTGGSSGGPWFQNFSSGSGTIMSVTSYGYSSVPNALHGPMLNSETSGMFTTAKTATLPGNIAY